MVLVVDEHADLCAALDVLLTGHGFAVVRAGDGPRALEVARTEGPDAVLLDVELPGLNGTEVCRRLRTFTDVPVLFLTGATDVTDQLVGFAAGADDYIPKPFHPPLLVARLQAHLRRHRDPGPGPVVRSGSLAVDLVARRVTVGATEVTLTRTEYAIVEFLAEHADRIMSREQLVDAVWDGWCGDDHVIDVNLSRLRQKLRQAGGPEAVITTHRGLGFRWNTRSGETGP
jgi:DNA-binding response OmpR family regulator